MDKYDKLLDAIEYPENYSPEELKHIASDPELSRLYSTLCAARSARFSENTLSKEDVEREWRNFSRRNNRKKFAGWMGGRKIAAAVTIVLATSAVLAVGISIGLDMSRRTPSEHDAKTEVASLNDSAIYSKVIDSDTVTIAEDKLIFEDETLDVILNRLAPYYGVKMIYRSDDAKSVRLFFKWESSLSINDVIEQLNTFNRIQLRLDGNTLTVN